MLLNSLKQPILLSIEEICVVQMSIPSGVECCGDVEAVVDEVVVGIVIVLLIRKEFDVISIGCKQI